MTAQVLSQARGASVDQETTRSRDTKLDGSTQRRAFAGAPSVSGNEDPSPTRRDEAAGPTTFGSQPPLPMGGTAAALALLVDVLASMRASSVVTTAAGVSARMRSKDPEFSPRSAGFQNFRALLNEAERCGLVAVEKQPGASDVTIRLSESPKGATAKQQKIWLHRDLWQALRGRAQTRHAFNRNTGRTRTLPDGAEASADEVIVPVLSDTELLSWITEFVDGIASPQAQQKLSAALDAHEPIEAFYDELNSHQNVSRRWSNRYRQLLTQRADAWADDNGIPRQFLRETRTAQHEAHLRDFPASTSKLSIPAAASDTELGERALILRAVERMSLAELLRLPIPAEYLLRL